MEPGAVARRLAGRVRGDRQLVARARPHAHRRRTARDGRSLIPVANMEHAYTPAWSPDGKTLAFSWWRKGGRRDIYLMDVATRAITQITDDRAYDLEPRFSPDGQWLYFVSDRTGVYNLFAYEFATKKTFQCTNVIDGVFDPAISPDGKTVAFVGFRALGYDARDRRARAVDVARGGAAAARSARRHAAAGRAVEADALVQPVPHALSVHLEAVRGARRLRRDPRREPVGQRRRRAPLVEPAARLRHRPLRRRAVRGQLLVQRAVAVDEHGRQPLARAARRPHPQRQGHRLGRRHLVDRHEHRPADPAPHRLVVRPGLLVRLRVHAEQVAAQRAGGRSVGADPGQLPEVGSTAGFAATWVYSATRRYLYSISTESGRYLSLSLGVASTAFGSAHDVFSASWTLQRVGADALGQPLLAQPRPVAQLLGRRLGRRGRAPQQLLPRRLSAAEPVVVDLRLLAAGLGVAARLRVRVAVRRSVPRRQRRVPLPDRVDRARRRHLPAVPAPPARRGSSSTTAAPSTAPSPSTSSRSASAAS